MWLLSTDRAELHSFAAPEDVPGGYAILSHVWDEEEKTFQQVQALRVACEKTRAVTRDCPDIGYKIRESCRLAQSHGWKWIWIDTCCIDKTSSAELSEAINSMFRYYALSGICYAFLRDVHTMNSSIIMHTHRGEEISVPSEFAKSRWHLRGWTLQELLAPHFLVFVSATWEVIGDKNELAPMLECFTHIPREVLRFEKDFADVSIAQRMSWAAHRQTTRVEDRAYSLMGIFGIHMPTLYGEGRMAFYRLQEEIMKTSTDTSLFAWGQRMRMGSNVDPPDTNWLRRAAAVITSQPESQHLLNPLPCLFRRSGSGGLIEFDVRGYLRDLDPSTAADQ